MTQSNTQTNLQKTQTPSRTRSLVFVALSIALISVSAWVSIPIGPVPFTLQMFALAFVLLMLSEKECLAAIVLYIALGAAGVPVFSNMRAGIGVLAGPTGGFLWGYILGAIAALLLLRVVRNRNASSSLVGEFAACVLFTLVSYLCGWVQFMAVAGVSAQAAFFTAIAPFVVVDVLKLIAAVACAHAVRAALGQTDTNLR